MYKAKSVLPYVTTHCLTSKTIIVVRIKIPLFLWYVIQFFTSASMSGHLQYAYEMSISSSLTSLTFPLPFPRKFQSKQVKYYGIADTLYAVATGVLSVPCDRVMSVSKI
jgi:hypothetical protein